MIISKCHTEFHKKKIQIASEKGGNRAVTRAAAFLRAVIRRKIRKRKYQSSAPGSPPFDHGNFKNTIVFSVNRFTAHIGPRLTSGIRNDAGQTVPNVLEFGGRATDAPNKLWWSRSAAATGIKSKEGIDSFVRSVGFGPLYIGNSPSEIKNGKVKKYVRKKYSPAARKKIYYVALPMRSKRMVERAAENIYRFFGVPAKPNARIAPRPVMGPSLEESRAKIAQFFHKSIKAN